MKLTDAEQAEFDRIRVVAEEMVKDEGDRNEMFDGVQDIFEMNWKLSPSDAETRELKSPGGHNVIRGMVNMMTGVEPRFNVPSMSDGAEDEDRRSRVEKALRLLFRQLDDAAGSSMAASWALSGSLFDMMATKLVLTKQHAETIAKYADKQVDDPATKKRLKKQVEYYKELAGTHPFLAEVVTPGTIYFKRGPTGVTYLVEARKRKVHSLREEFGETACAGYRLGDEVTYYEYWDRYQQAKWTENTSEPFLFQEYGDPPFIPYIVHEVNGTQLFGRMRYYPTLFPIWKSDVWQAQNMALTLWRTNLISLGHPTWKAIGKSAQEAEIPTNIIGGRVPLEQGDDLQPLAKELVPKEMAPFYQMIRTLEEESTVNKMVFGKAPENVLAYSTVNMLVQGARHSLVALQGAVSRTGTDMARKMLRWLKESGTTVQLYGKGEYVKLAAEDITDEMLMVEVEFRPDIPSDRLQLANMAIQLTKAGTELLSKRTARSMAGSDQPDEEDEQIIREQMRAAFVQEAARIIVQREFGGGQEQAQQGAQPQPGGPSAQQGGPSAQPGLQDFIPPPMEQMGGGQGATGQEMGLPQVQTTGAPSPEFTQSAAENMSQLGMGVE